MLQKHEIEGSDLPVILEKTEGQFTLNELIGLEEDPKEYEVVGFNPFYLGTEQFFNKLYMKKEN